MNPRTALLPRMAATVLLAAVILPSCYRPGIRGNGHITTETRAVSNFHNIESSGAYQVEWSAGAPNLTITTDRNLLPHIKVTNEGDKLKITADDSLSPTEGIKVKATSDNLTGAQFSGAVKFHGANLSGANFYLETEGAAKVTLDGNITSLTASMSGASKLSAENLRTQTTELSLSGAGAADVWASESLKVAIQGAGKVTYSGNPKNVTRDISGAGKITPKQE